MNKGLDFVEFLKSVGEHKMAATPEAQEVSKLISGIEDVLEDALEEIREELNKKKAEKSIKKIEVKAGTEIKLKQDLVLGSIKLEAGSIFAIDYITPIAIIFSGKKGEGGCSKEEFETMFEVIIPKAENKEEKNKEEKNKESDCSCESCIEKTEEKQEISILDISQRNELLKNVEGSYKTDRNVMVTLHSGFDGIAQIEKDDKTGEKALWKAYIRAKIEEMNDSIK